MKKKKLLWLVCGLLALALLIPIPRHLKDGGTVAYQAVLYRVEKVHRLNPAGETPEFLDGTTVRILGLEVYNSAKPEK